jgi:hypothetical protein
MPRFLIFPFDPTFSSTKLIVPDAANLLLTIQRLECKEAEVKRDREYAFSARLRCRADPPDRSPRFRESPKGNLSPGSRTEDCVTAARWGEAAAIGTVTSRANLVVSEPAPAAPSKPI